MTFRKKNCRMKKVFNVYFEIYFLFIKISYCNFNFILTLNIFENLFFTLTYF